MMQENGNGKEKHITLEEKLKQKPQQENKINLEVQQKNNFLGTQRRKEAMSTIVQLCRENLPMEEKKFLCILSYKTNLTIRKLEEDYINVLLGVGILQKNRFNLEIGIEEKNI
jgi:hypothetical protein